jgi:hypothetical protein
MLIQGTDYWDSKSFKFCQIESFKNIEHLQHVLYKLAYLETKEHG